MLDAATLVFETKRDALKPARPISVTDWAEKHRVLDPRESALSGPYRVRHTPYMRDIMNALSADSPVERVAFMKGAQIGASEAANNWVGYLIDTSAGAIMYVLPTVDVAKRHSKQRIAPMIAGSPRLTSRVRPSRSRDSGNTTLVKEFTNGMLLLAGANSSAGLRSTAAPWLILDEVDSYPQTLPDEGDPVLLAERCTRTFSRRKIVYLSTPTIKGRSRIETLYEQSDQSQYWVPCPHCGEMQILFFQDRKTGQRGICWEQRGRDLDVYYQCVACKQRIEEGEKAKMLERGEWRARVPELSHRFRGFALSSLYAPPGTFSWRQVVEGFLRAKGHTELLRVWVNQVLGESWQETGDAPDWETLFRRRETYQRGTVPTGGIVLTAGVDVQRDRLECEVVAWGRDLESWNVDYFVLNGDVALDTVWTELDRLLARSFPHELGASLKIRQCCIDSGFETQRVYAYVRERRAGGQVLAVKGSEHEHAIVGQPSYVEFSYRGRKLRRGVQLWHVGASVAKKELFGFLRALPPLRPGDPVPPGLCHWPELGEDYFKSLASEQLVARQNRRGYLVYEWCKTAERNEALDCRVYARAAAAILAIDRWSDDDWKRAADALLPQPRPSQSSLTPTPEAPRRSSYWDRWRGHRMF